MLKKFEKISIIIILCQVVLLIVSIVLVILRGNIIGYDGAILSEEQDAYISFNQILTLNYACYVLAIIMIFLSLIGLIIFIICLIKNKNKISNVCLIIFHLFFTLILFL